MVPLLSLLAALSMTTVMLLIPIVIETATKWEQATRFLLVKNIGITLIWILLLVSIESECHNSLVEHTLRNSRAFT